MTMVLLYGIPHGCSFGSIVALEWSGQPYKLYRVDMLAQPKDAGLLRINPQAKTPALIRDDGSVLTESAAILNHIASRDLTKKLTAPQGTVAFDRVNSMLAYLNSGLFAAFLPAWSAFKLPQGSDAEVAMLRGMAKDSVSQCFAHLEKQLEASSWLAGDQRTIADAYFAGIARWGEDLQLIDIASEYPVLHRHMQTLEKDPAVRFAHAMEEGETAQSSGGFEGLIDQEELLRLATR